MQNAHWGALIGENTLNLKPEPITGSTKQIMQGDGRNISRAQHEALWFRRSQCDKAKQTKLLQR